MLGLRSQQNTSGVGRASSMSLARRSCIAILVAKPMPGLEHAVPDSRINDQWLTGVDPQWIDIGSTARINGVKVGTVKTDPLVYGAHVS
jgi:hypothetical protein